MDLALTKCNQLVVLSKVTLEKAGIKQHIHELTLPADLANFNISEHHPLASQFTSEPILTFDNLLTAAVAKDLRFFLLISNTNAGPMLEALRQRIDDQFMKYCVLCTTSPLAVYKLRKQFPNLVCGLWINKPMVAKSSVLFRTSAILMGIYMAIVRNIVAPVIGVKAVFLHKDEFNA